MAGQALKQHGAGGKVVGHGHARVREALVLDPRAASDENVGVAQQASGGRGVRRLPHEVLVQRLQPPVVPGPAREVLRELPTAQQPGARPWIHGLQEGAVPRVLVELRCPCRVPPNRCVTEDPVLHDDVCQQRGAPEACLAASGHEQVAALGQAVRVPAPEAEGGRRDLHVALRVDVVVEAQRSADAVSLQVATRAARALAQRPDGLPSQAPAVGKPPRTARLGSKQLL
mmetsp:Transcript_62123/g.200294  ORF Transcript_62123/g.200294 Transcript_62123/m.200294 type:complete len:229 (-) Transcript_62123:347-1033(-)